MRTKVLIIEDEKKISDWLVSYFIKAGFQTEVADEGFSGMKKSRNWNPEIIILDLNIPGIGGIEVCQKIRMESDTPIIMLTAKDTINDRVIGLSAGADDYVVKPFDPNEVIARIEAVLRRTKKEVQNVFTFGRIKLYTNDERVTIDDIRVEISHLQFILLHTFFRQPGRLFSREQLLVQIHENDNQDMFDRSIDKLILKLRKILKKYGLEPIQTVYGGGYKFLKENC